MDEQNEDVATTLARYSARLEMYDAALARVEKLPDKWREDGSWCCHACHDKYADELEEALEL